MAAMIKRIIANFMDDSGKASNQQLQIVLSLDSKSKPAPKEMFGKLIEAVDTNGTMETYPFSAKVSTRANEITVDYGSALQDDESSEGKKEAPSNPMGLRYARLTIVQGLTKEGVLTLQGMDGERSNFRITKVEDF